MWVPRGSKLLPCGHCQKYFYKENKLIEHRRTTHGENSFSGNNNSIIDEVQRGASEGQERQRLINYYFYDEF